MLNDAAIRAKVDYLEGMKENVICGHKIPAGTGQREFGKLVVGSMEAMEGIANVNRMRNPAILDEPQTGVSEL